MKISIENQDRLIFLIYLILIATPFITVVGLPLPISDLSIKFNEAINNVPDGGTVLWLNTQAFSLWVELGAGEVATYKTLFKLAQERNVKIIFWATGATGWFLQERTIYEDVAQIGLLEGLTYGEDYAIMGYIPGGEATLRAIAVDTRGAFINDWEGTPVEELPIFEGIYELSDFALVGWSGYYVDEYARQWSGRGVPLIVNLSATTVSMAKPWFEEGLVNAYLNGQRGSAEFEALSGYKGFATSAIDAQSLAHLYAVILLIIPNIYFILQRAREQ